MVDDIGWVVGMESMNGLVGSSSSSQSGGSSVFSCPFVSSNTETSKQQEWLFGSGYLERKRSGGAEDQDWRCLKMARKETMLMPQDKDPFSLLKPSSHSLLPDWQQMLCFSATNQHPLLLSGDGTLPCHQPLSSPSDVYYNNAGLSSGSIDKNMNGVRGLFTPSQWIELERQALIYKHIEANAPLPISLLISVLKPSGYSRYSDGSVKPSTCWVPFHLGISSSTDPQPGRCRRTDGKKWRCPRDAIFEQKYCERHLNRGRSRSRKPVEGHKSHARGKTNDTPLPAPPAVSGGGSSNVVAVAQQQQQKCFNSGSTDTPYNQIRIPMKKENLNDLDGDLPGLSMSISMNHKSKSILSANPKHNPFDYESFPKTNFSIIPSNSLPTLSSSYPGYRCFASYSDLNNPQFQPHSLHSLPNGWPKVEETPLDLTQLLISIPMTFSGFSSSATSPEQEKPTMPPLQFPQELDDPVHMCGVEGNPNEENARQANWVVPISWEASMGMGGPLGEVLNKTYCTSKDSIENTSSALNPLFGGWCSSPPPAASPTWVLQKTALGSQPSSTGSSPRA